MTRQYAVRTLYLANFFSPAADMATARRANADPKTIIAAMKRTEMADQTLEKELNAFSERGFSLEATILHPTQEDAGHDLILTLILGREGDAS